MAIKVNGTTVIDDSRNLANVGGLKTVNGTSLVGSGNISAGASTTYGAVGTYTIAGMNVNGTIYSGGNTIAGSSVYGNSQSITAFGTGTEMLYANYYAGSTLSGTWRVMVAKAGVGSTATNYAATFLVRIS